MKKTLIENVRTRGYKLLLYADNPQHMRVLSHIRRDPDLRQWFVGCWHIQRDDEGREIVKGAGKKHYASDTPQSPPWHLQALQGHRRDQRQNTVLLPAYSHGSDTHIHP